jgi:hypothetical protein
MPAYARFSLLDFVTADPHAIHGQLEKGHARDGYATQFSTQTIAWDIILPALQKELGKLLPDAAQWAVLLEFPLYRLRRRIDAVILTGQIIVVLETKVGEASFRAEDVRQVEEYALDLRDFHAGSHERPLLPVLWCTSAPPVADRFTESDEQVARVHHVGKDELADLLASIPSCGGQAAIEPESWDNAPYTPVPNVIEAATTIFSDHDVRAIAQSLGEVSGVTLHEEPALQLLVSMRSYRYGVLLALISCFFAAANNWLVGRLRTRKFGPVPVFATRFWMLLAVALALGLYDRFGNVPNVPGDWLFATLVGLLGVAAPLLCLQASIYRLGPSVPTPLIAFHPACVRVLQLIAWALVGAPDPPNIWGVFGLVAVTTGILWGINSPRTYANPTVGSSKHLGKGEARNGPETGAQLD